MGVVTQERLNSFMSNPQWTQGQKAGIQDVLDGLERDLESALCGAYITPRTLIETAPILFSGQVATKQVVYKVLSIDGTELDADDPLPTGWYLHPGHKRLYWDITSLPSSFLLSSPAAPGVRSIGTVRLTYEGGWGADPGLVGAIMRKASAIVFNLHDDSLRTRGTDGSRPLPMETDWTEAELAALGSYRNLSAFR